MHKSGDVVVEADTQHHLLFVEHPPVYTLGKSGSIDNVLISEEDRKKNGMEFFKINRRGYYFSWPRAISRLPDI